MLQFDYCMSYTVAVEQDDNRYNASRGAHLNLKRAEKARVLVNKIPGIQRVNMPLLMVVDICQGSNTYMLYSYSKYLLLAVIFLSFPTYRAILPNSFGSCFRAFFPAILTLDSRTVSIHVKNEPKSCGFLKLLITLSAYNSSGWKVLSFHVI